MEDYIKSPKTGRYITVGGPAYVKLLESKRYAPKVKSAEKVKRPSPGTKTRLSGKVTPSSRVSLQKATPRKLSKTLASTPSSRRAKRASLRTSMEKEGEGRGSRTRGWAAAAPQRGRERHALKEKCGDECFLMPDTESFPICAALREGRGCKVDCRGVTAAKVRASQWKYPRTAKVADELERKYKC